MNSMVKRIKTYNIDELIILGMCLGIFLPYALGYALLAGGLLWLIKTKRIEEVIASMPFSRDLILFLAFSVLTSAVHKNLAGIGATVGLAALFAFFAYYNKHCKKTLVEDAITLVIGACTLIFTVTVILVGRTYFSLALPLGEFMNYMEDHRVVSVFYNPNYYAMVVEFYVVMTSYRGLRSEDRDDRFRYGILTILGLVTLFFAGSRIALPVILVALLFMCYRMGRKKIFYFVVALLFLLGLGIVQGWDLLPRYGHVFYSISDRVSIWKTTLKAIGDNMWTGQGPMGYMNIYKEYNGYATQHAHNMLLDILLNFGVFGIGILAPVINRFGQVLLQKKGGPGVLMAQGMLIVTMLHGIVDLTLFWHQTAFMLLLVLVPVYPLEQEETFPELLPDPGALARYSRGIHAHYPSRL